MESAWPSLMYAGPSDVMMLRSCTARFTWPQAISKRVDDSSSAETRGSKLESDMNRMVAAAQQGCTR